MVLFVAQLIVLYMVGAKRLVDFFWLTLFVGLSHYITPIVSNTCNKTSQICWGSIQSDIMLVLYVNQDAPDSVL